MTKREILVLLLAHYQDALEPGRAGGRADQHGSRLLLHDPDLWCVAFDELDRCLSLMRNQGRQQSVTYTRRGGQHDGRAETCSLATARQHVLWWFTDVAHRMVPVKRRHKTGKRITVMEARPIRHPEAREDRAEAGLSWLVREYDFRKAYPGLHWLAKEQRIPGMRVEGIAA